MIIPDINLLIYAHNERAPEHAKARAWWETCLTTDAHMAALAVEHQAELHSADTDFSRFPGLRWRNPLTS